MIIGRSDLEPIVVAAVKSLGIKASVTNVAKYIWSHHEKDLRASGDFFYVWQYDMRRVAEKLRNTGILKPHDSSKNVWELV